ncbi:MAG: CPBP family intramembrane metalloprotease [Lachnospiraceae bacterium]|nr:CPBP family intramembrane metalloprotease [Lachnospiraceae bacterium]
MKIVKIAKRQQRKKKVKDESDMKKHFSKLGFMYFLGTILVFAVQIGGTKLLELLNPAWSENYNIVFLAGMLPMYIIAMPIMAKCIGTIPAESSKEKKKMTIGQWMIAFFMCYAGMYICNFIGIFITTGIGILKQGSVSNVMAELSMSLNPWVNLFVVVICAPIAEELLFRKLLIDRTVKYGEGVSVVLSGFIFALYHGNLNQFVYAFFMGAFWGFIYVKTRNIRYTIVMHMVMNFFGSFVSTLLLKASGYDKLMAGEMLTDFTTSEMMGMAALGLYGMCLIAFVITGIVLWIVNRKKFVLNPGQVVIEKGNRFKTIILNWGMGLFCIFWLVQIVRQLLA